MPASINAGLEEIWGRGEPGAVVEVLLDGTAAISTTVDESGYWSLEIDLPEGEHLIDVRSRLGELTLSATDGPIAVLVLSPTPTNTSTMTNTPKPTPKWTATTTPPPDRGTATQDGSEGLSAIKTAFAASTPTETNTPKPTPTATPTPAEPAAGTVREFGGIPFVYVPAGEFLMGSTDDDAEASSDEKPQRDVYLDAFWIMQTEVTNAQYGLCVAVDKCRKPNNYVWDDGGFAAHPVTHVSWSDAVSYAQWLSDETDQNIHLPSEAEWEKAARGADGDVYPWGNEIPTNSLLNYGNVTGATTQVGIYPEGASPYGGLDMAGNVWEWTADWYDSEYYVGAPDRNPLGPDSGDTRVARGGSWRYDAYSVRSADRHGPNPDNRRDNLGLRLVVSSTPDQTATQAAAAMSFAATETAKPTQTPTVTNTPEPTPMLTETPTPAEPAAGTVREFGGIPFVYVPAGKFLMGSTDDDADADSDEKPQRSVYLDAYWIMQTEVTNAQYAKCVAVGDCPGPNNDLWDDIDYSDHPVTHLRWGDVVSFATWLSGESSQTVRLPTEAEWEKAARGTDGRIYPWGNERPDADLLNFSYSVGETTSVASYPDGASPYGALDMAGNVWEWTSDRYDTRYYENAPARNPIGPDSGDLRVIRGGAWYDLPFVVRSANRFRDSPGFRNDNLGLRLVVSSPGF